MRTLISRLIFLILGVVSSSVVGAGEFKSGLGWPDVSTPIYHAKNSAEADARLLAWRARVGHSVQGYYDTGSMQPVLGGGRELMAMELCLSETPLARGQMVVFNRGDLPAVLHYIAAISRDGQHLYLSGIGNRRSDGWFHRETVSFVVREIVTRPEMKSLREVTSSVIEAMVAEALRSALKSSLEPAVVRLP